eukprot:scaffold3170_cov128-Cylindrotheca_fusiformis.AAC.11
MDHHHPILFDEVAKAAIPIIDTFNSQRLANLVSAIARMRRDSESRRVMYFAVADAKLRRTITAWTKQKTLDW